MRKKMQAEVASGVTIFPSMCCGARFTTIDGTEDILVATNTKRATVCHRKRLPLAQYGCPTPLCILACCVTNTLASTGPVKAPKTAIHRTVLWFPGTSL